MATSPSSSPPVATLPPPPPSFLATTLASASAGVLSRVPVHPIDTLKARLQVDTRSGGGGGSGGSGSRLMAALSGAGGVRGLYRGFGVAFVGSGPACVLYFGVYEAAKGGLLGGGSGVPPALGHLASGFAAEAASCVLWVPIDVVKERMQVQGRRAGGGGGHGLYYRSTPDAVAQIWRGEGLRGLYRGYGATLASFGPFSAVYFGTYEWANSWMSAPP